MVCRAEYRPVDKNKVRVHVHMYKHNYDMALQYVLYNEKLKYTPFIIEGGEGGFEIHSISKSIISTREM